MKFLFTLALALGKTVEELTSTISQKELDYWMAYNKLEPWGAFPADYRNASLLLMLSRKRTNNIDRFMPFWRKYPKFKKEDQKTLGEKILLAFGINPKTKQRLEDEVKVKKDK